MQQNMKNKLIAVDMDEVLLETAKGLLNFYNYTFAEKPIQYNDIIRYNFETIPGYETTVEYAVEYFMNFLESSEAKNILPVQWAKDKLNYLKSLGYKFVIITGRAEKLEHISREYIKKHYPNIFEEMYFCGYYTENQKDKYTVCQELGITTIIEDHLENSIKYAQQGIEVILLDKPRNQDYNPQIHKHITKVKSWDEITLG
ncbi:MAG: hypothetical protein CR971_00325 [candidate division SR1 bacterium]|nr:MAG: hypothetical protein CR971_00325 [candidate division SR1 bacterium]